MILVAVVLLVVDYWWFVLTWLGFVRFVILVCSLGVLFWLVDGVIALFVVFVCLGCGCFAEFGLLRFTDGGCCVSLVVSLGLIVGLYCVLFGFADFVCGLIVCLIVL